MAQRRLSILLFLVLLVLDQWTKSLARNFLYENTAIEIWPEHFRLQLAYNTGAFLSFGASWPQPFRWAIFIGFVIGFLIFLWRLLTNPKSTALQKVCYTLVLSGGVGNLIDRIAVGHVTDFLWLGWGPLQTGVFNIADMAILFGVLILIFEDLLSRKQKSKVHS